MTQNFSNAVVFGGAVNISDPLDLDHMVQVDHFGNLNVTQPLRLCGTTFTGTSKDINFWLEAATGTGAVAQANGICTLTTGATANSTASYTTIRKARWLPYTSNHFHGLMQFSNTGSPNNIRQFGCYDSNDGFFFQLNGTTFNIVTRIGGVDAPIAQASWNVNPTSFVLDTNLHGFDIQASYREIAFYIDGVLVHEVQQIGMASLAVGNITLPAVFSNANSGGGTANVTLKAAICCVYRHGAVSSVPAVAHITGNAATWVLKYGAGNLHRIIFNNTSGTSFIIYDGVSAAGVVLATITTASGIIGSQEYGLPFNTGLCIVTTGNGLDLTVVMD